MSVAPSIATDTIIKWGAAKASLSYRRWSVPHDVLQTVDNINCITIYAHSKIASNKICS